MARPPDSGEGAVTEYENAVPRRGRPPKITRDQIIDAVLASGFSGLTIPALAQRLGVTTMTIYRHAATRSELLAMAWEKVLERHTWPDCDGAAFCTSTRRLCGICSPITREPPSNCPPRFCQAG